MKNLRKQFNILCYKNRDKGIPNLMLYIMLGAGAVYLTSQIAGNMFLYNLLVFDRTAILHGQVWRLISYPLTFYISNPFLMLLSAYCYVFLGKAMESAWGTFKFNLFYLTGVVMMDIYCMIIPNVRADVGYLNLSLFLSFATMAPDAGFLLFFIIPVKAWIFALVDLFSVLMGLITNPFPYNLFPVISLANYFLFFGKDVLNLIPLSARNWVRRKLGKKPAQASRPKVIHFEAAPRQERPRTDPNKPAYTHRCTVCGKTDVSHPDVEFRYCSKCRGYFCYCEEHISKHEHII